jgi:arylformamidase
MSWIDITLPIRPSMVTYPGDPEPVCRPLSSIQPDRPETCSVTEVILSSHTGTHVDAPCHFVAGGAGIDEISLDTLCGSARVVELPRGTQVIDRAALEGLSLRGARRVLFKTANSERLDQPFTADYVHLDESGAEWLRDRQICLVGIDYLSVEAPGNPGHPVHHVLLEAEPPVIIVEGLDLRRVAAGDYELCVLPLRLVGVDGAPARAMVRPER